MNYIPDLKSEIQKHREKREREKEKTDVNDVNTIYPSIYRSIYYTTNSQFI